MYQVIFVDDEAWALIGLKDILPWEEYGFHVCSCCSSAEEALREIALHQPDAVFTDIRMPKLNGIELISKVRQEKDLKTEFVIISAYSDFEVARKAIEYGAMGYLLKPLEIEEVRQVALRLKARLDKKKAEKTVSVDIGDPISIRSAVTRLQDTAPASGGFVVVTEKPFIFPHDMYCMRLDIPRFSHPIYFCSGKSAPPPELPEPFGCSTYRQNIVDLKDMIEESIASFQGGFHYSSHRKVAEIQAYLGKNYNQNLSLTHLAKHFFLSENYLCDLFKKNTDDTILKFIRNIRLKNACCLLEQGDLSIKEIAGQVGFSDYNYFGRIFRQKIGQTPDAYRNRS